MRNPSDAVRDHLVRVLDWEEAHVGFDKSVAGLAAEARGARPPGVEHSVWQLLEHIRLGQEDILQFCLDAQYSHHLVWPDDYWPKEPSPPDDQAWHDSIAACLRSRERLQQLARDAVDLTASVPTGKPAQTYLRAILLAADHVAYHVGQIVMVRKALGAWG
jgi:DinB superfamily